MRRLIAFTLLAFVGALPALAEDQPMPVEQQLLSDFAARLEMHMHKTAALLQKIRETQDPQERDKLMKDYQKSMRTTMKIDQLMRQVAGGDDDMGMASMKKGGGMMKGKKMGGMCACMMGKKGGKKAAAGGDAEADAHAGHGDADDAPETAAEAEQDGAAAADEHAGHH